jgi:1-acyl-sn-glycerol-3-phosphate acyltransferase
MSGRLSYLFYEGLFFLSFCTFSLGWSLRVRGRQNMPRTGPVLVIANHQSYLDPLLVGLASPRHLSFLAKKSLFDYGLFSFLIRCLHAVPIDQEGVGKEGLKTILQQLHQGRAVLVFPEGSRTDDGKLLALRPGIQLLLKRVDAPVVPIGIAGAWDAWPRHQLVPYPAPLGLPANRRTLAVSVGKPVDGAHYAKLPREEALKELTHVLSTEHKNAVRLRRK